MRGGIGNGKENNIKTIGIVGSRSRDGDEDLELCKDVFVRIYKEGDKIVSGGCPKGGDRFAEIIAKDFNLTKENGKLIIYPAEWDKHGKSAGFKRNIYIAQDADVLIAVIAKDRKGGTEDTIRKAEKLKKQIILI